MTAFRLPLFAQESPLRRAREWYPMAENWWGHDGRKLTGGFNVCRFGEASLLVFFLGSAQCYLAAQNLTLAAYGLGYGSCMIGAFDQAKTRALLDIPKEKRIPLFVAIGVADEECSNEARFTSTGESLAEVCHLSDDTTPRVYAQGEPVVYAHRGPLVFTQRVPVVFAHRGPRRW